MSRRRHFLALLLTISAACGPAAMDYAAAVAEGEELFQAGAYDEAYRLFDRLRRRHPDEETPYRYLARSADRLGRPGDAVPALEERAARGGPGAHVYLDLLATALDKADRRQEAEERYREAIRVAPDPAPSYLKLSRLLGRSGRVSEALAAAREGIARSPGHPGLRSWYGDSLRRLRRWAEAEAELRQALDLPGAGAYPHYALGLVYLNTGRLEEARRELERATELRPDASDAWYQLANACERLGDGEARDRALGRFAAVFRRQLESGEPEAGGRGDG